MAWAGLGLLGPHLPGLANNLKSQPSTSSRLQPNPPRVRLEPAPARTPNPHQPGPHGRDADPPWGGWLARVELMAHARSGQARLASTPCPTNSHPLALGAGALAHARGDTSGPCNGPGASASSGFRLQSCLPNQARRRAQTAGDDVLGWACRRVRSRPRANRSLLFMLDGLRG